MVGNLSYQLSEDELRLAFSRFGEVSAIRIIKDRYTDRSKGFGFVEMPVDSEADAAIRNLDGQKLKGRALRVNETRPRENPGRADSSLKSYIRPQGEESNRPEDDFAGFGFFALLITCRTGED